MRNSLSHHSIANTFISTRSAREKLGRAVRNDPALVAYLADLDGIVPLTRDEERHLGRLIAAEHQHMDELSSAASAARQHLINANLPLVVLIAACYAEQGMPLLDLIGAGNIGLIRAVDKYVPGRARFATHATWWIREACSRYLMKHGPLIHVPRRVVEHKQKIRRIEQGHSVDDETVAQCAALTPEQVRDARQAQAQWHVLSLDTMTAASTARPYLTNNSVADDDAGETLAETLAADDTSVEAYAEADATSEKLYRLLATVLSERERNVLLMRFGLGALGHETSGGLGMLQREVAVHLGITTYAARQIELGAIVKLRDAFDREGTDKNLLGLLQQNAAN